MSEAIENTEINVEQAADLAHLSGMVNETPAPIAGGELAEPVDSVAEARAILAVLFPIAGGLWAWLKPILTPEKGEEMAQAWGPVLDHYGMSAGGFFNHPLAAACMATIPLGAVIYSAYQEQHKTQKPGSLLAGVQEAGEPAGAAPGFVLQREPE